jgi:hypothetical protein
MTRSSLPARRPELTTKFRSVFWAFPPRLASDTRGVTLPLVAASITALIGFTGLGVETGLWYAMKRQNQSAADVAALSGALELAAGQTSGLTAASTYPDICGLAERDAARNNFSFNSFTCPTTSPACTNPSSGQMCANNPPVLGANAGNANYVEVILAQQQNTLFANLFLPRVTIKTRAVAFVNTNNSVCLLTLGSSSSKFKGCKSGFSICGVGNASITAPGCSIVADGTTANALDLQGSVSIDVTCSSPCTSGTISTAGNISLTGSASTNPTAKAFQQVLPDPYASLTHAVLVANMPTTACAAPTSSIVGGVTWWIYPSGCKVSGSSLTQSNIVLSGDDQISGGLTVGGKQTVLLNAGTTGNAGTYWITDGDLNVSGTLGCTFGASTPPETSCDVASGAGITIILTTAQASGGQIGTVAMPPGNTSTSLSAPTASTTATFKGDLIIQDSNGIPPKTTYTTTQTDFQGTPSAIFTGLVYLPNVQMNAVGNASLGGAGCLVLVVQSLTMTGNPQLNTTGCAAAGVTTPVLRTIALTE